MAVYEKGKETRRKLVLVTNQMLKNKKASNITVRAVAKEVGCSPAALYRHFDNMEYLIVLASIHFFENYITDYGKLMESEKDLLKQYLKGWKIFIKYAFERPDLYYRLMWGQFNASFSDALSEYIELFPLKVSFSIPDYFYTMLFNSDIIERDYIMLKRAVNKGFLSEEDARYFSISNPLIVKGMLEMYMDKENSQRKQASLECSFLIEKNMEKIFGISPDKKILKANDLQTV
ncbi:regulatory protein, tetR family [Acetitomaculum ruminis DSM 5522]|uniref:Regulatory protein, tetR family n=1 Tax=Acetitomaculum ruminis DSM 5522 TaxID=1120918 RepID=A0A1I0YJ77_9FIRM|nr:TetR/AcrR family transcriptional regulator [Acetitomaculum ruminis]SFB12378.1 regulatory protein, tetR family [Acetitomaculum ruminis DSM 5522]